MYKTFGLPARPLILGLILSLCVTLAAPLRADPLRIFAAASLKSALDQVVASYQSRTGLDVSVSYGGSSAIARQIQHGAPADIFISANVAWMESLSQSGHVIDGTRRELLGNRLVVAGARNSAPLDSLHDLPTALQSRRLAMAQVDAVPAGIYGMAALHSAGVWAQVADQVAQTDNVRAALALVALGAAPYGIVYQTDARADPRVSIAYAIPAEMHAPIIYPVAAVRNHDAALEFLAFLHSPAAARSFAEQGFIPLNGEE